MKVRWGTVTLNKWTWDPNSYYSYCPEAVTYHEKQFLFNTSTKRSHEITAPAYFISGNMFVTYDSGTLKYFSFDDDLVALTLVKTVSAYLPPIKADTVPDPVTETGGNVFFRYQSTDNAYYDFHAFGKMPFVTKK